MRTHITCPKCKTSSLVISEICEAVESWVQNPDGDLEDNGDAVLLGDVIRVEAKCSECNHKWSVRGIKDVTELPNWPKDETEKVEVKTKPKKESKTKNRKRKVA